MAPEIFIAKEYQPAKSDVFSLGVMIYYLLFNKHPYMPEESNKMEDFILALLYEKQLSEKAVPVLEGLDKNLAELLRGMLQLSYKERFTIGEVKRTYERLFP